MITCNDINTYFNQYRENIKECLKWDDRIFSSNSKEQWLDTMKQRSYAVHQIFLESKDFLENIIDPILENPSVLQEEHYDCLLSWLRRLYYGKYDEPFLMRSLTELILPFYEKKESLEDLVFLYTCAGYANIEISQMFDQEAGKKSVAYYKKTISYKDKIEVFRNPLNRACIFVAYSNLICVEPLLNNISLEEAYSIWQELCSIRSRKKYQQFDSVDSRIPTLVNVTIDSFIASGLVMDLEQLYTDSPIRSLIDDLAKSKFASIVEQSRSVYDCDSDLVMDYYLVLAKKGEISWDKCWQMMDEFYLYQAKHLHSDMNANMIGFYFVLPITLIETLEKTTLPKDLKELKKNFYLRASKEFLRNYPAGVSSYDLNHAVQRFAFHPLVLDSFETKLEKEHFLFEIVLSRHLTTFTHSVMVSKFAEAILNYILVFRPELLIAKKGCFLTRNDVLRYKTEIYEYIKCASLLHDIGKNAMTDIINTQHRKISNREFAIIKTHPQKGAEYLSHTKDFEKYEAVALGHHRSYDGRSGYPETFDNRNSIYAPAIDLVRICDCLDAATDTLTRYYHNPKTFDQVMQEFFDGKGTQYHPGMIDLIFEHHDLYEELRWLTMEGREETYYHIYQQFIKNKS